MKIDALAADRKHLSLRQISNKATSISEALQNGCYHNKLIFVHIGKESGIIGVVGNPATRLSPLLALKQ